VNKKTSTRLIAALITMLVFTLLAIAPTALADLGPGVPGAGTIASGPTTYTFFSTRVLTSSTPTTYTLSPSRVVPYYSADVFVTGVVSGTDAFTVTAQVSADGTNWATATYQYVTSTLNTATYQLAFSSSTTKYMQIPIVGEYLRFKIENGGTVTPTIKVTLKNTGGR
jgi:hypothetical protein